MKRIDLTGLRFGRLIAIARVGTRRKPSGQQYSTWRCRCDCGNEIDTSLSNLRGGITESCGCLLREIAGSRFRTHGQSKNGNRSYGTWVEMRSRCYDSTHKSWHRYGGRGITIDRRWENFENFFADMGERPIGMEIERIDNDGNYELCNCRWATKAEQSRNRHTNIIVMLEGRTQCLLDWCKEKQLPYDTVRARIKVLNWTPLRALTTPVQTYST